MKVFPRTILSFALTVALLSIPAGEASPPGACGDLLAHALQRRLQNDFRKRLCETEPSVCFEWERIDLELPAGNFENEIEKNKADIYIELVDYRPDPGKRPFTREGKFVVQTRGEILAFDISLSPKIQGRGIYIAGLRAVTEYLPKVRFIPSRMRLNSSDNAKFLVLNAFGTFAHFHTFARFEVIQQMSDNDRAILFEKIMKAYRNMPSTKARDRAGFAKLNYLAIDSFSGEAWMDLRGQVVFIAEKSSVPVDPEKVVFDTIRGDEKITLELSKNGEMKRAEGPPPNELIVYDEMRR